MPAWDLRLDLTSLLTKISRAEFWRSACGTKTGGHYCMGRRGVYFPAKQDAGTQTRYWSHACMLPAVLLPPSRCPTDSMHQHLLPCPQPAATASIMSPTCMRCSASRASPMRPCTPFRFCTPAGTRGAKGENTREPGEGRRKGGKRKGRQEGAFSSTASKLFPPLFPPAFPLGVRCVRGSSHLLQPSIRFHARCMLGHGCCPPAVS